MSSSKISSQFKKQTHRENILARPDTYVGDVKENTSERVLVNKDGDFIKQNCVYVPALLKIFDELIVNATDASKNDKTLNSIWVNIDVANNTIEVTNNGIGIPTIIHDEYKVHIPTLIFGHLLTSTNYDDTVEREVGGRNGYGAKLTNIYSSYFEITTNDFTQVFEHNMSKINEPTIHKKKIHKGVKIIFKPDLSRFGMNSLDSNDTLFILKKRVYDITAVTSKIKVYFNNELVNINSFTEYVKKYTSDLFSLNTDEGFINDKPQKWNVCLQPVADTLNQPFSISFVNGINTQQGGSHVDYIYNVILTHLKKKHKDFTLNMIKRHMYLYINATIINPSFSSQSKDMCNSKINSDDVKLSKSFLDSISKSSIVDGCLNDLKKQTNNQLSKTDGKKKNKIYISKLDDANKAGTNQSHKCTICFTEGDSAKASIMAGFSVVGRDYWGAFPLRGKMLNVTKAKQGDILKNEEISNIKKIIGLEMGKTYEDISSLRYGRIMICTDQDLDGYHIRGLLMNMFKEFWPELFNRKGFITSLNTPIVKILNPKLQDGALSFYNLISYNEFIKNNPDLAKKSKHKYYKGLGTSNTSESKDYFKKIDDNTLTYLPQDDSISSFNLAFDNNSDARKDWLSSLVDNEPKSNQITHSEFIHTQLKKFSNQDNLRSIPHLADGLKPSNRKVLHTCFINQNKVSGSNEIKVCDLAGLVSQSVSYHHGETSLHGTIINMAQDFVGSNNINLLLPNGQFGSREQGGADHASPRYINTQLNPIAKALFNSDDLNILKYEYDDGKKIEPKYFVPIIPMILVNGAKGIGTGHSTTVPQYNPKDIISNIKKWINNEPLDDLKPWYKGFTGKIVKTSSSQYTTFGTFNSTIKGDNTIVDVTELPIGLWTGNFREHLHKLMAPPEKLIKNFDIHTKDDSPRFVITLNGVHTDNEVQRYLKLKSSLSINNMTLCFNDEIKHYNDTNEIINDFCKLSFNKYKLRKAFNINKLQQNILNLHIEIQYIRLVVNEQIIIFKRDSHKIIEDIHNNIDLGDYDINNLLNMPISRFTNEKIKSLEDSYNKINKELIALQNKSIDDMWVDELNELKL